MSTNRQVQSSIIYDINPACLRKAGVELKGRNRDNAYRSDPVLKRESKEERAEAYNRLKESIRRDGFKKDHPILIHLNRKNGKDKIAEGGGHHRLAIAIELGLATVPVRFVYDAPTCEHGTTVAPEQ